MARQHWHNGGPREKAGLAETTIIEQDEPRVIYRDKLAAAQR